MRKGLAETVIIVLSAAALIAAGLIASYRHPVTIEPVDSFPELAKTGSVTVYVTESGKRYHAAPACGSMKAPISVSVEDAEENGYTPCSLCIQDPSL